MATLGQKWFVWLETMSCGGWKGIIIIETENTSEHISLFPSFSGLRIIILLRSNEMNIKTIVDKMRQYILNGSIVGSYLLPLGEETVVYTHSGLRPAYLKHVEKKRGSSSPKDVVKFINDQLVEAIQRCSGYKCSLEGETFQAGKDRGGSRKCCNSMQSLCSFIYDLCRYWWPVLD